MQPLETMETSVMSLWAFMMNLKLKMKLCNTAMPLQKSTVYIHYNYSCFLSTPICNPLTFVFPKWVSFNLMESLWDEE